VESAATEELNAHLRRMNFYNKMYLWADLVSKCGLGVTKLTFSNGPSQQNVNPGNIAWDPTADQLRGDEMGNGAHWVIEKYNNLTLGDIKLLINQGVFKRGTLDRLLQSIGPEEDQTDRTERERTERERSLGFGDDRQVTLYDMVTPERIITVHMPSSTLMRDIENPYGRIYYYDMVWVPEPFEVQGYALPVLLEGLQREINIWRQQRTDIRSLIASPQIKIRRRSGINIRGQRSRPGKVWPVIEPDDVTFDQMTDTGMPLVQEEMSLVSEGDRLLGILAHTRGERGEQMKATVATMLAGNVGTRFAVGMKRAEDYPMRIFLKDFVELCKWQTEPISITRAEWRLVHEAMNRNALEAVLHTESHVGNPLPKIQLYGQLMQMSQQVLKPEGHAEIIREALKLAQFPDPEKVMQHIIPFAMQLQMAQAGGAQGRQKADQGQGVPIVSEMARGAAPGQAEAPIGIPV